MNRVRIALVGAAAIAACAGVAPGEALAASETCTAPTVTAVDGWHRTTYLRLVAQEDPNDPRTTWICYRVAGPEVGDRGGRIEVTEPLVSPTLPSVDSASSACTTTTPNAFPGPRPLVSAQIGDDTEPLYVPLLVDAYLAPDQLWACLRVGNAVTARLKVATSGIAPPAVNVVEDAPGTPLPPARTPAPGLPSSACETAVGMRVANMNVAGAHVYARVVEASPTRIAACLRVERPGLPPVGGRVWFDTNDAPGVTPVVQSSTDTTPCTSTLLTVGQPLQATLARSPQGTNPASVCVTVGGMSQRLTIGTTGTLTVPLPGAELDPDMP